MKTKVASMFASRRFWAAVCAVVAVVANDVCDQPIDPEQLTTVVMVVVAWLVGDSLRETAPK